MVVVKTVQDPVHALPTARRFSGIAWAQASGVVDALHLRQRRPVDRISDETGKTTLFCSDLAR
jgi:hypothetical protein